MRHILRRLLRPPVGAVDFGDLGETTPIGPDFGYGRGTPVDRYYIEGFLDRHRTDICGRALEIADAAYCTQFGSGVVHQDILHVSANHPGVTIVGDLSHSGVLPPDAFDCMVITQTLHLIYDMAATIRELHRGLKPGGVLLLTVPGVSSADRGEWREAWLWSLTAQSAMRLFAENFPDGDVTVETQGNVYAATCFLQGLALQDVEPTKLDRCDSAYPVVVTVRAVRR